MTFTSKRELARLKRAGELPIAHTGQPCLEEHLLQRAFTLIAKIENIGNQKQDPEKLKREARRVNAEILKWGVAIKERQ